MGTNTFHLLVGRLQDGSIEVMGRDRIFVKVASDGIAHIGAAPFARAIAAAEQLAAGLAQFPDIEVRAFGTAALRTASNGPALREALEQRLGVAIQIIDGQREATLIAKGVFAAQLPAAARYLVMDIGGGSVEFVLTDGQETRYRESFPVGAQVLRQQFHQREPFGKTPSGHADRQLNQTVDQPQQMQAFLRKMLAPMLAACTGAEVQLVGSSGTFDVLANLYGEALAPAVWQIDPQRVRTLYAEATHLDEAARLADPRIPADRADMIVVALGLIVFVLDALPQNQVLACAYALKEGALLEMLEE